MGNVQDARREMTKTKEQLEEEKKISLSIRIKPLELDGMDGDALKEKASELWEVTIQMRSNQSSKTLLPRSSSTSLSLSSPSPGDREA